MKNGNLNPGAHQSPYVHMANFQQKMLEHNGFNPIHQARVAKDFQMQKPKLQPVQGQTPQAGGSPWLMLGGK